jgi:hypothetical protein
MSYIKQIFLGVLSLSLFGLGCKSSQTEGDYLQTISGLEFEVYYAIKNIDTLIETFKPKGKSAYIEFYLLGNNKPRVALFSFVDTMLILNVFEIEQDKTIQLRTNEQLSSTERKKFIEMIMKTKPYSLCSIEDLTVIDGYTAIVKNVYNRFNMFSVRVYSSKGKASSQYLFVKYIADMLCSKGIEIKLDN